MSRRKRILVPEAQENLDKFKEEVSNDIGIGIVNSYQDNSTKPLNEVIATSGQVGGEMVKRMIAEYEKKLI